MFETNGYLSPLACSCWLQEGTMHATPLMSEMLHL